MPQVATIDRYDPEVVQKINATIHANHHRRIIEILSLVREKNVSVSCSALHRHIQKLDARNGKT